MAIPDKPSYDHGSTGTEPASQDYETDDPLEADNFDYFIYTLFSTLKGVIDALNTLDSDDDGRVDAADTATNVKGNDIDSNGDGTVDEADSSLTYKSNDIDSDGDGVVNEADYANDADASTYNGNDIDSDGDGIVNEADSANAYKGNDIDSDGDGVVNNADQVDGYESNQLAKLKDGVQAPVYASLSDVPDTITKGELIFNDNDNTLYIEDST